MPAWCKHCLVDLARRTPFQFQAARKNTWRYLRGSRISFGSVICSEKLGCAKDIKPTLMYSDNQGSIAWATENSLKKVKHIDLRYHFTNMLITSRQIHVKYIESANV
jgi:hypothetical protein